MDTICALSSGAPPAAIAVIRMSGPRAGEIAMLLAGTLPPPRTAALRSLHDGDGALLDRALLLFFPGPASATGEDVVELHVHGGRAVTDAVLHTLRMAGARFAEPGEFTRRALGNGRIDLAQAEGLADLLQAETEQQRRAAITASEGALSRRVARWAAELAAIGAAVEVAIDYADEGDAAIAAAGADVAERIAAVRGELAQVLAGPPVERVQQGWRVVVAGPRNSGKSSLVNALSGIDAAIVSPIAGTTRDRVEVPVVRDGERYTLVDTAGLGETGDPVEAVGIARAQAALVSADLLLWTDDVAPPDGGAIWLRTKVDLTPVPIEDDRLAVSVLDEASIERVWRAIAARTSETIRVEDTLWNARQRALLKGCSAALSRALDANDDLVRAEELRVGHGALSAITGRSGPAEMLDTLFTRFCVGK